MGGEIGLERGKASGPAAAGCGGRRGLNCGVRLPAPPQPNPTACYLLQGDSHAVGSPEPIPWGKKKPPAVPTWPERCQERPRGRVEIGEGGLGGSSVAPTPWGRRDPPHPTGEPPRVEKLG